MYASPCLVDYGRVLMWLSTCAPSVWSLVMSWEDPNLSVSPSRWFLVCCLAVLAHVVIGCYCLWCLGHVGILTGSMHHQLSCCDKTKSQVRATVMDYWQLATIICSIHHKPTQCSWNYPGYTSISIFGKSEIKWQVWELNPQPLDQTGIELSL